MAIAYDRAESTVESLTLVILSGRLKPAPTFEAGPYVCTLRAGSAVGLYDLGVRQ